MVEKKLINYIPSKNIKNAGILRLKCFVTLSATADCRSLLVACLPDGRQAQTNKFGLLI